MQRDKEYCGRDKLKFVHLFTHNVSANLQIFSYLYISFYQLKSRNQKNRIINAWNSYYSRINWFQKVNMPHAHKHTEMNATNNIYTKVVFLYNSFLHLTSRSYWLARKWKPQTFSVAPGQRNIYTQNRENLLEQKPNLTKYKCMMSQPNHTRHVLYWYTHGSYRFFYWWLLTAVVLSPPRQCRINYRTIENLLIQGTFTDLYWIKKKKMTVHIEQLNSINW